MVTINSTTDYNWTTADRTASVPSLLHAVLVGTVLASIAVGAVIGNALVVLSVLTNPKLRTITNRFVCSLACADLSVGTLVMPLAVKVEVTGTWNLGETLCDVWISFDVLLCTASILNLCAISIDRYMAVTRPLQTFTGSWRHRRLANAMIAGAWVAAVVITCPPLFGWREAGRSNISDVCTLTQNPGYVVYSALGSFYIPLVVMLILYGNIYKVTRNRLPADVRLRRGASIDQEFRRPECTAQSTTGTPLMRSVQRATSTKVTTNRALQAQKMNSETSSESSEGRQSDVVLRQTSEPNIECFEMTRVEEERHQTASRPDVHCPHACPTSALNSLRVWRSNSSRQSRSTSVTCASLSNMRYSSSKNEWRHTSCLAAGEVTARRENKAAKTLAIVVGGFISCWLPFFVLYIVEPFCSSCRVSDAVRSVLTWLGYANSLVNPFIYATYNRHFRHSFWSLTVGRFHACLPRTHRLNEATDIQVSL